MIKVCPLSPLLFITALFIMVLEVLNIAVRQVKEIQIRKDKQTNPEPREIVLKLTGEYDKVGIDECKSMAIAFTMKYKLIKNYPYDNSESNRKYT